MSEIPTKSESELELICWLINRFDTARGVIANRAAIVLSADAIALTAVALLIDKSSSQASLFSSDERSLVMLLIGLTLILLAASMYYATTAIANVWKVGRDLIGPNPPHREFFYPRDTIESARVFESFERRFTETTDEQLRTYALGELWSVINATHMRYQRLRRAIRFVIFSLVPLFLTLLLFLSKIG